MGWSVPRLNTYYQAALNLMPLSRSIHKQAPEPFYDQLIAELTATGDDNDGGDADDGVARPKSRGLRRAVGKACCGRKCILGGGRRCCKLADAVGGCIFSIVLYMCSVKTVF
jgi:hypothetical protein